MKPHRRLLARLLDHGREWDEAEADSLLEALRTDPEAARLVKDQLLLDNLLSRTFSPERRDFTNRVLQQLRGAREANRFIEKTMSRTKRVEAGRSWRPAHWALAAAVVVGVGVTGLLVRDRQLARAPERRNSSTGVASDEPRELDRPRRQPEAKVDERGPRIEKVEGAAFVVGKPGVTARPGAVIQIGQALVTTGGDSAVTLTYGEATRVRMRGNSSLVPLAANQIFITRGRVEADVAPPDSPMIVSTPHGEVVARVSRFALSVMDRTTRLDVERGSVRFGSHRGGSAQEVAAGRYAQTTNGAEPVGGARAPGGRVALLTGSDNETNVDGAGMNGSDRAMKARLEKLGFEVAVLKQGPQVEAEARQSDLVVVSDSVSSQDFTDNWLRTLPVPLVVMEWFLFDDVGMSGPCGNNEECGFYVSPPGHLFIKDSHHPLAAGLAGTVKFTGKWVQLNWGTPNLNAAWVANVPGFPTRATIFAYEGGAEMFGLSAPARRVALPMRGNASAMMTDEGWMLFDAAVQWCADPAAP